MLVLLPPSEGKSSAPQGAPALDLGALVAADVLTTRREAMLAALAKVSARPDAAAVLKVGPSLAAEVAANTGLPTAPAAPASEIYTGVLYAAAGLTTLDPAAAARADRSVRIFSALWGIVAPGDRIPAYRFSMGVDLPGHGRTAAGWREPLAAALDDRARREVVVDARSAAYAAAWQPPRGTESVTVRVVRETAGVRTVVSHHAKHTRGVLVGHLLRRSGAAPTDAAGVRTAATELVGTVIATEVASGREHRLLDATLTPAARGRAVLELVIG